MTDQHRERSLTQTAIVTGAGSGIGKAVAIGLITCGWRVIAIARTNEALSELASQYPGIDPRPADLTSFPYPDLVPDQLDALVHAAGLSPVDRVEDASPEDWNYAFALNVTAGAELARRALPALRKSKGTVVFINSGAGVVDVPRNTLYGATKHALRILANGLREEVASDGIRVASIFPGPVDTPLFTGAVDRNELIRPETVASAVINVITMSEDAQVTETHIRPRQELSW